MRKGFSPITQMRLIMCMVRCFYECSDGKLGWSEVTMTYGEELTELIDHYRRVGMMVTTEHFDMV